MSRGDGAGTFTSGFNSLFFKYRSCIHNLFSYFCYTVSPTVADILVICSGLVY